jgi:flagellar L-ring protein precursor FlgH
MKQRLLVLLIFVLLFGLSYASADHLWDRRVPNGAYLFMDNKARRVGDLLTIVIREGTNIENREQRNNEKKTKTNWLFNFAGSTTGNIGGRTASANATNDVESQRKLDGTAQYTSDRKFTDRMTVTVIQVLPNGNLVIEGTRDQTLQGENRTIKISGVVRPQDIGTGNTIESSYIANFQVTYRGKGIESAYTQQGWLGLIMNKLWPF